MYEHKCILNPEWKKIPTGRSVLGKYAINGDQRERRFLEYVRRKINPQLVYYPGSGFDQIPRQVFGKDRCTYISLRDSEHYFEKDPPDVIADFRKSPFPDETFDLIYVHGAPEKSLLEAVSEFGRVLRRNGSIAVVSDDEVKKFAHLVSKLKREDDLIDITPKIFKDIKYKHYSTPITRTLHKVITRQEYFKLLGDNKKVRVGGHCLVLLKKAY